MLVSFVAILKDYLDDKKYDHLYLTGPLFLLLTAYTIYSGIKQERHEENSEYIFKPEENINNLPQKP